MNVLSLFTFGVLATLPMGPAGMNVAASAIRKKSFPHLAFMGFLTAEAMYLVLAFILKDMMIEQLAVWKVVTSAIAGIFILFFGLSLTHKNKKIEKMPEPSGYKKSFLITASNPAILLLHLTVLLQVESYQPLMQATLISSFLLGGVLTLLAIVFLLIRNKDFFTKHTALIENICGYLLIIMSFMFFNKTIESIALI